MTKLTSSTLLEKKHNSQAYNTDDILGVSPLNVRNGDILLLIIIAYIGLNLMEASLASGTSRLKWVFPVAL